MLLSEKYVVNGQGVSHKISKFCRSKHEICMNKNF